MPRLLALLVLILAACEVGCIRQDASVTAPSATQGETPKKLWPVEMAAHVEALARAGRLDEARVWWFRGVTRSLVWDSLAQAYAAETFNRGVTANILRLSEVDMEAYAQLQLSALEWEATAPLDLPEQFPSGSVEKLPQIRAQLSTYVREGIEAERERRAPIDVIKKQIAENRPVDEAIAVIPEANRNLLSLSGAVFTGCDFGLDFPVQSGASASDGGWLAAISSCNQLQIVNMATGAIVQANNELEDRHYVLAVYPDPGDIGVLTFKSGPLSDPKTGFYRMTSKVARERIDLPLPSGIPGTGNLSVKRSVASTDGRIAVLEMCAEPACPVFAAYDLAVQKIVWQGGNPDKSHERLIASVIKLNQDYVLVSELRPSNPPFAGADATETLNLTDGKSNLTKSSTLEFSEKPTSVLLCNLMARKAANAVSPYGYEILWPGGRAPTVLKDPVRAPIGGCTVSPDGRALLVIVAPFVYRYEIHESKKVGASRN